MDVNVKNTQQGECNVTPDYQKLYEKTLDELTKKTKEVDRMEYRVGLMTRELNNKDEQIAGLTYDNEKLSIDNKKLECEIQGLKENIVQIKETESDNYEQMECEKYTLKKNMERLKISHSITCKQYESEIQALKENVERLKTFEVAKWIIEKKEELIREPKRPRTSDSAN